MKYENEMFQDLMGIVIETDDVWLNKKLNNHVCYKGGGGGTTTATPEIPEEFKPFAREYSRQLTDAARKSKFGQIGEEAEALKAAQQLAKDRAGQAGGIGLAAAQAQQEALTGKGMFAPQFMEARKEAIAADAARRLGLSTAGRQASAMGRGTLGSARSRIAQAGAEQTAMAQLGGQLAEMDAAELAARRAASERARGETAATQKGLMADVDILRGVGKEETARAQMMAEAPVRGLKEMAGLFTGIPMGQTQTTSGGGK
jgi:hypothetical protein